MRWRWRWRAHADDRARMLAGLVLLSTSLGCGIESSAIGGAGTQDAAVLDRFPPSSGAAGAAADSDEAEHSTHPDEASAGAVGFGVNGPAGREALPFGSDAPDVDLGTSPESDPCSSRPPPDHGPVTVLEHKHEGFGPGSASTASMGRFLGLDGDRFALAVLAGGSPGTPQRSVVHIRGLGSDLAEAQLVAPAELPDGRFGDALALSGDTLAVGAPENWIQEEGQLAGRVHVFQRGGSQWAMVATLRPEGTGPPEGFGTALALDGDTLIAGVAREDTGSVEVFTRGAEGWQRSDILLPIEARYAAGFGVRVALDGNTLAVGAMWGVGKPGQAVHVFERRDGRFEPKSVLAAEPGAETFGLRMALRGNLLAVSDTGWDNPALELGFGEGAVYLYERECEGAWVFRELLTEPPELVSHGFGGAVAIDGDRIVVANLNDGHAAAGIDATPGEPSFDDNYTGAVHVFGRSESGYQHLNFLKDTVSIQRENYFGWALSADNGRIVIGARGEGAVYTLH